MALDVENVIAGLDPAERRKVEKMAAELVAEEMTLRELHKRRPQAAEMFPRKHPRCAPR